MQLLIIDAHRRTLAVIDVPDTPVGEPATIVIGRADRPDLHYVAADLYVDGTVSVGLAPGRGMGDPRARYRQAG
ncbi:hypothetical protein ACFWGI_35725 [Streptomyces niveus]|uniref:hypothetical protein n=1 Tax=Streptomyces niveus TaxID=193462 RepID=UPI00366973F7